MSLKEVREHLEPDRTKDKILHDRTLYALVEKLASQYTPSQKSKYDVRWFDFYLPSESDGKQVCIPFAVISLKKSAGMPKDEYFLDFHGEENGRFSVVKGEGRADEAYYKMVQSVMNFPLLTDKDELEKLVPYEFRTGKIKRKHIVDEAEDLWSKKECGQVLSEYSEHAKREFDAQPVSLNGYLRIAAVGYRAAFPNEKGSPLALYKAHADFRHGGMLDIKDPESAEEFNAWLKSRKWEGSHPFEIVMSGHRYGVHLSPPNPFAGDRTFTIAVGNDYYAEIYIAMLRGMMKENLPVLTQQPPMLTNALNFLSGDSYFTVNRSSEHELQYLDTKEEKETYFHYIRWDKLKVLKRS